MTCESGKCTKAAVYQCTVIDFGRPPRTFSRDYCAEHTQDLVDGMTRCLGVYRELEGRKLHQHLEIEHVREMTNA